MTDTGRRQDSKKIRVKAQDQAGNPIARMRVELVVPAGGDSKAAGKRPTELVSLRGLSTSRDGFAIFSLDAVPSSRLTGKLAVRFAGCAELTFPIDPDSLSSGSQYLAYTIAPGPWMELEAAAGPWLDDGLEPGDIWAVPGVFPDLGDLVFGDDYCGRLVPHDLTVRIANHVQVVRRAKNVVTCLTGREDGCRGCDGLVRQGEGDGDGAIRLHEGELIKYEVKCARLGYTFGDLLYSLPLAPCESVTLAISHWEQRQKARAEQETESRETRNATYFRQNALSEVMDAASQKNHLGWAAAAGFSTGSGGSASGIINGILAKATAALQVSAGASASGSYDRAHFASNATRTFSDRIQQESEAWRRDHQVVVIEQSESEDQQVSYRTVCNNNHCHVLNIFYHEVLNNFRMTTKMLGHRDIWFVPYEVRKFDLPMALCAKPFLLPFLMDPNLADCYAKLKVRQAVDSPPQTSATVDEFKIDLQIEFDFGSGPDFILLIKMMNGSFQQFTIPTTGWQSGQSYSYTVNTPNIDPADIHEVGIHKFHSGSGMHAVPVHIASFTISAKDRATGQWVALGSGSAGPTTSSINVMVPAKYVPPPAPASPSAQAEAEDSDCAERLLAHLNCHKVYYNSLLWLLEDPNERFCRFDNIVCGDTGTSLADLVIPEPLAVMGCYVAFAKAGSDYIPFTGEPIVDERLLTLPTSGIFADAALGRCTTCETKDPDVYWDWKDSPCVCGAKDVTLKTPSDTNLIQAGVSPFPGVATGVWATGVMPPAGEGAAANSLVGAFGAALANAMLSGNASEMSALQDLLGKLTAALKDLIPKSSDPPKPSDPPKSSDPPKTGGAGG
jgi:hypothetical protein